MLGRILISTAILGASGWGALAIHYGGGPAGPSRTLLAAGFALGGLAAAASVLAGWWPGRMIGAWAVMLAAVLLWWASLAPSNDRQWQPETAELSYATIDGDLITLHNIRNFEYRSETDFDVHRYDKTFDLRQLNSADLVTSYWTGPAIAHVFVSFGFEDGSQVAISVEARKERGEGYSSIAGFFRRYELYYLVADERDVIRLRTNYRRNPPEDVYLYRLKGLQSGAQRLFMQYMKKLNRLKQQPAFYNSLTSNCTNSIWLNTVGIPDRIPYSWEILVSGYLPRYLYDQGRLDTSLPFTELQRRSRINERAQAADRAANFSRRIREPGGPG